MRPVECVVSRIVLGVVTPTVLMLAGWWGSLAILGDSPWIPWAALIGLLSGVLLDLTVLRVRLDSLYSLPMPALAAIAVFYSVMIYGFFMGLPIANLLVGVGWGFALARRHTALAAEAKRERTEIRAASLSAAAIMLVLCCLTAWMALREPTIGAQVREMLGLPFTPSIDQLRVVSLVGGVGLVIAEYFSTAMTAGWAARSAHLPAALS